LPTPPFWLATTMTLLTAQSIVETGLADNIASRNEVGKQANRSLLTDLYRSGKDHRPVVAIN